MTGAGEWKSSAGGAIHGTWKVALTQTGSAVGGMLKLTGSNVFTGGAVTGQVEAQHVTLALVDNGATQATFSGDLVDGTVSGQWQCPAIKDTGVWFGTLQAMSSQAAVTAE